MKVVYLTDSKRGYQEGLDYFDEAASWASQQCASYVDFHVQDISDVSYEYDNVAQYRFTDPKDALMFQLKWKDD